MITPSSSRPPAPGRRRPAAVAALAVAIGAVLPWTPASAAPAVGGATAAYTEQAAPTPIGTGITVAGGAAYDGNALTFAVGGAAGTESLGLGSDSAPDTAAGAVSVVGSAVYLGDGSGADVIGTVDGVQNGQAGRPLTVTFGSAFLNAGFETGDLTGWTAINQQIDLGVTSIAGHPTVDTSTYPGNVPNQDNNVPSNLGSLTSTVQTAIRSEGTHALRLVSSGMQTNQGCDVVHGPAVYSSPFEAAAGDSIYFDWRAYAGADNFHVFGYVVDNAGNQVEVLDQTGGGTTNWATQQTTIPSAGQYRFVFVSGTHDFSCGRAAGASLIIDNVRVFGSRVTDTVVQTLARRLTYANTSDNPPASRTVTVSAASQAQGTGTGTVTIAVTGVDDAPTLAPITGTTFTNVEAVQTFTNTTGTLVGTDPEGDPITYGAVGAVADSTTVGGVTYTHSVAGTYGRLRVNETTGAWVLVPDRAAVDARTTGGSETYRLTATAAGQTAERAFTVVVDVPGSNPGVVGNVRASAADGQLTVGWDAPAWPGGSAIISYRVQTSVDGTTWTTAATSATAPVVLTGLANGVAVLVRVSATNSTGTGTMSGPVTATPFTVPGVPTVVAVVPGNRRVVVAFTPPASDGGRPVTGYQHSVDGGRTWVTSGVPTGSRSFIVDGLVNRTSYTVLLRAVNQAGAGQTATGPASVPVSSPVLATGGSSVTELGAGAGQLLVDGQPQPITISTEQGALVMTGPGLEVVLGATSPDGRTLPVDDEGRMIATQGGTVRISGEGFRAGSTVDVWMFSTPNLLGDVVVASNGTFSADLPLPAGIAAGVHTVQLNGVSVDGQQRTLSVGITVRPPTAGELATTGGDQLVHLWWAAGLLLLGAAVVLLGRRRAGARG